MRSVEIFNSWLSNSLNFCLWVKTQNAANGYAFQCIKNLNLKKKKKKKKYIYIKYPFLRIPSFIKIGVKGYCLAIFS